MGNDESDDGWSWGAANAVCQRDADFLREEWGPLERSDLRQQGDPHFRPTFREKCRILPPGGHSDAPSGCVRVL